MLIRLAIRDLLHERIHLICNVAVLAGVIVPLLVLFGVKNGVYATLIDRYLNNPNSFIVQTSGNQNFTQADIDLVAGWPEVVFVTGKTRSIADTVFIVKKGERVRRDGVLTPSGTGDPTLSSGTALPPGTIALSANLSRQLNVSVGDEVVLFTDVDGRPRQLALPHRVVEVLGDGIVEGRAILAHAETLDLLEAFYDEYALPEYGITAGRALAGRQAAFEGIRLFVRDLTELSVVVSRLESTLNTQTNSRVTEIAGLVSLSRNLDIALLLTAIIASFGLAAAFVFGFWGEVERKKNTLATLALLGTRPSRLWVFPMTQAAISATIGLLVSFGLLALATLAADALFRDALGAERSLVQISSDQAIGVIAGVFVFVMISTYFAAKRATRIDPAIILREGAT